MGSDEIKPAVPSQRLKLTLAYDGAGYAGWQWQEGAISVQQRVEEALARLFPSSPRVHSSSRTDTGVHAAGMVAHLDVPLSEWRMTARKLVLEGLAHGGASDIHRPEDQASVAAGMAWINKQRGQRVLDQMLDENPRRILSGELPDAPRA